MNVKERNDKAKQFILDQLTTAALFNESDFQSIPEYHYIKNLLTDLIYVEARGFRGIVATALTGAFLDKSYDYLNDFYACNPRSIFEQGIYYAFKETKIPCGKSDPLNVAKNISVLDEHWAKGKRPASAALAAVKYLRIIYSEKDTELNKRLINYFFFMLLNFAKECGSVRVEIPMRIENTTQLIAEKLYRFTINFPESGVIPQFIVAKLLNCVYEYSSIEVMGGDESVFGTNTTSKKPADIWLVDKNKTICNLYEITVKKIDFKRLDDCIESLSATNCLDKNIIFICRVPFDIESLEGIQDGTLIYKGKVFNFIDISSFIKVTISLITEEQVTQLVHEIADFINLYDRAQKTKRGWSQIFNDHETL
ncbi:hypothetical protein ACEV6G_15385 [Enterobacter ludwigii]|uniref:hypothetical protein n=1 Tax=Enterobacter ludwigii TaxID=299767 RepID=UPI003BEF1B7D